MLDKYPVNTLHAFRFTGNTSKCLNLGSYNYLGFAEASGPCAEAAIASIYQYGVSTSATRQQYGTCPLHDELERLTAEFLGVEDAITFGMGKFQITIVTRLNVSNNLLLLRYFTKLLSF